ncbi:HAD family hydrolase [Catenulispora sp. NF23]|uniref:HAD family hydrolase n=1 Tax=Catenulispora pinistramenti TaxID=2705254 RepID=UPI001BAAB9CC|nr:HAD-IA family hydrolase [Catenulispora pinistramenti]MBS2534083.1 HAD family hydrolase [Catenulispora pinistramenti]
MSTVGVLLWDFDGTLGERPGMWSGALMQALDEVADGHDLERSDIAGQLSAGFPWHEHQIGHPCLNTPDLWWAHLAGILSAALKRLGVQPDTADLAARAVREIYPDPTYWRLFDDTLPVLGALSGDGWSHVLVSNHVPELDGLLAALGLRECFSTVVNSAVTGYEKPHPEAFRLALEAAGHPRRVWMIGDSWTADVRGAQASGIPAIHVRTDGSIAERQAKDLYGAAVIVAEP